MHLISRLPVINAPIGLRSLNNPGELIPLEDSIRCRAWRWNFISLSISRLLLRHPSEMVVECSGQTQSGSDLQDHGPREGFISNHVNVPSRLTDFFVPFVFEQNLSFLLPLERPSFLFPKRSPRRVALRLFQCFVVALIVPSPKCCLRCEFQPNAMRKGSGVLVSINHTPKELGIYHQFS